MNHQPNAPLKGVAHPIIVRIIDPATSEEIMSEAFHPDAEANDLLLKWFLGDVVLDVKLAWVME